MKIRLRGPVAKPAAAEGCLDPDFLDQHSGEKTPAQLIRILKQALAEADGCLEKKFHAFADVNQLVKARAWVADQLILFAWHKLIPSAENVSLVAVGGFGRGELHPHSDIDLLILLAESPPTDELRLAIEAFVTLLWDAGFYLGHSVRTVEACVSEAKKEIATATSLMESRLLSGSKEMMQAKPQLIRSGLLQSFLMPSLRSRSSVTSNTMTPLTTWSPISRKARVVCVTSR